MTVRRLLDLGWLLYSSAVMQARQQGRNPVLLILGVMQPVVFLTITLRAADHVDHTTASRLASAVLLTSLWNTTVWAAGGILRGELRQGTLAANVTGAYPPHLVLFGKCFGALTHAACLILLSTAATLVVTGTAMRIERPILTGVGILLALLSGTLLGTAVACLFVRTMYGPQLSGALMYPVYLLGGMLIPPTELPQPVQWATAVISLRWANSFIAHASAGTFRVDELAILLGLTAAYGAGAMWLFARVITFARKEGRFALD